MTERRLGRRPPKNAPSLKLARVLTGIVPAHPASVDHFGRVSDFALFSNDRFGVCGPAAVGNQRKLLTRYLTDVEESPTQDDVYDLYRRSGNPGFNPILGEDDPRQDDNGVDMQTMCEALVHGGIGGRKALGFAKVDVGSVEELRAGVAIFGSLLLGVDLTVAQRVQTEVGLWDYQRADDWGGHAVLAGRYEAGVNANADRTAVVTWAQVVDMTDAFMARQLEEAWVVIWPEHVGTTEFLEGVNLAALAADYRALTGRGFPVPVAPSEPPVPTPGPPGPAVEVADRQLAQMLHQYLAHRHTSRLNREMAAEGQAWLTARGL